jgi:hypothetical protein
VFGLADAFLDLIKDYDAYLQVKKGRARSEGHRARVTLYLERMLWGAEKLEDVTPGWVEDRLEELLELPIPTWRTRGEAQTISRNTVDCHRSILGTWFRWLKKKRRLAVENPVEFVDALEKEDARDPARAFTRDELRAFWRVVPPERRLIYATWATTGLRPTESRRLPWTETVLDAAEGAHFVLRRSTTKNGRPDRQPIHPRLVALLRAERARAPLEEKVFPTIPTNATFARDLKAAGLWERRRTAEGKLTRYSMRKTFITALVSDARTSPLAQKLARHASPDLTYGTYTTFDLRRKVDAVASLDLLPGDAA